MANCSRCGTSVPEGAGVCPACGQPTGAGQPQEPFRGQPRQRPPQPPAPPQGWQQPPYPPVPPYQDMDKGGFLWGLLGFVLPQVGLVLFLVWRTLKPRTAKAAGIGALVGAIVAVVAVLLVTIMINIMLSQAVAYAYWRM